LKKQYFESTYSDSLFNSYCIFKCMIILNLSKPADKNRNHFFKSKPFEMSFCKRGIQSWLKIIRTIFGLEMKKSKRRTSCIEILQTVSSQSIRIPTANHILIQKLKYRKIVKHRAAHSKTLCHKICLILSCMPNTRIYAIFLPLNRLSIHLHHCWVIALHSLPQKLLLMLYFYLMRRVSVICT
jgi:hypothetical protein